MVAVKSLPSDIVRTLGELSRIKIENRIAYFERHVRIMLGLVSQQPNLALFKRYLQEDRDCDLSSYMSNIRNLSKFIKTKEKILKNSMKENEEEYPALMRKGAGETPKARPAVFKLQLTSKPKLQSYLLQKSSSRTIHNMFVINKRDVTFQTIH